MQSSPATVFGVPVASAWTYVPDFNPQTFIDQAGYSADVAATLRSGVAAGPVGATVFAPMGQSAPTPLIVSGGSVTVSGDTIDAGQASLTARTARITIVNESPNYLVLGRMTIANVEGGNVHFRDSKGGTLADPRTAGISRDSATATITVDQRYAAGVAGSEFGPAVFLAQAVENLGGDVTIKNAKGSFGQTGTIAAKRITIDTPNGVFAVDTPNADWTASGTPSAQWADTIMWPGGRPGHDQLDGNQAVMYAINAIDSGYGTGWRNAASEDELNHLVYGDPRKDRNQQPGTFVFFGGSLPQYDSTANSQGHNEGLAAAARHDGQRRAWQMTDKKPSKASWDHAWMPRLQKLPSEFTNNTLPSVGTGTGTAVRGQVIVINAKTANVNGTLEAGGDRAGNQSVVVPAGLEAVLLDYQRRYRLGEVTTPIYRIREDQLQKSSATDRLIGASFDARTSQIILDSATSSGGGTVSITGRIINTGGDVAGKIKVRGGSGDLVVRNDTHLPLVTASLQTGGGGRRGLVSITDLNVEDTALQQVAYVYDGTDIRVYRGARGADLVATGDLSDRLTGSQATFHPRPDARWQWTLGAELRRDVDVWTSRTEAITSGWRFDNPDVTAARPWGPWTAEAAQIVFESRPDAFVQRLDATSDATYASSLWLRVNYDSFGWDTGFSGWRDFWYSGHVSLDMTMSVKADWPIGIDFSGTSFGEIRVTSLGDVVLAGNAVAGTVKLESTGGVITTSAAGGTIATTALDLRALGDIGTSGLPLRVTIESVTGSSTKGGIWIDGRGGDATRPLVIDALSAPLGLVQIMAAGPVRQGRTGITAAAVSVESVAGGIGTFAAPLVVATAAEDGLLRFDAVTAGDIQVRQSRGGMLVGSVLAAAGSVVLEVHGDLFNADTWTIDPAAVAARIRQFEALGATDPDAYRADVAAFEGNVTSRYNRYWSAVNDGDDLALWRLQAAAALGIADPVPGTPSDDQIRAYVAAVRGELEAFFADTVGADWRSRPQFAAFDPAYRYAATPAQIEGFRANRTVTAAQLAVQLAARALDAPPPGESVPGRVNVAGRNVTLVSNTGSVGKNDDPVTITAADLASGNLTDLQRQELALAAAPGDARLVRAGDTVTAVVLNVRRPLVLAVSGRLDVDAPEGVAVAQQTGDLRIGRIGSRNGLVSVIADRSLLNAPARTIDMWSAPVDFSRPDDWSLVGSAGQTLSPSGGLYVPGFANSASGTWLKAPVPTSSFKVSFTYEATSRTDPGDGLAFVLAKNLPTTVGGGGGGLGYNGLPGPKAGFLVNIYGPNTPGTLFDSAGTWSGGGFKQSSFTLAGRPVYVTLEYDALNRVLRTTISDQPDGQPGTRQTFEYKAVDLAALLGGSAFIGFTSGTGAKVTSQRVTNFAFATGATLPGERVELPTTGTTPWVVQASPTDAAFTFSASPEGPVATFANRTNAAAAAWYPTPVRISQDFSVTFRYRHTNGADGMALVFQNAASPTAALGGAGGSLGYAGIAGPKVGYLVNIFGTPGTRFDTTGSTGNYNEVKALKDLEGTGNWITITLTYDAEAKTLTERIDPGYQLGRYEKTYENIDLVKLLGSSTATFGFTAASGWYGAKQEIQSLVFDSPAVPLPLDAAGSRGGWQLNGGVQRLAAGTLVIPDRTNTATSTWFERPVTTANFEASFVYEAQGSRPADGLAFVLQRSTAGLAAIGTSGNGLGYTGMPGPKVGLLFNIFDKPGVRLDTGGETGGFESVPWLVGGPVTVRIVYDATTGTLTATLSRVGYTPFSKTWSVDLSNILGSQAFVGFTSGTGLYAATQTIQNFKFRDRDGIASDRPPPAPAGSPTVRLWSSYGTIGASGDEIAIRGVLEARAPNGSIHTNPPPAPAAAMVGGTRRDGMLVTNQRTLSVPLAAPGNRLVYSTNGGRTWRRTWRAAEGLNDVLVAQIDARGIRSAHTRHRFVLDTKKPAAASVTLLDRMGRTSRTGRLRVTGVERGSQVEYSVNGGAWSAVYVPVQGVMAVRVRVVDLAGNVSRTTRVPVFTVVAPSNGSQTTGGPATRRR